MVLALEAESRRVRQPRTEAQLRAAPASPARVPMALEVPSSARTRLLPEPVLRQAMARALQPPSIFGSRCRCDFQEMRSWRGSLRTRGGRAKRRRGPRWEGPKTGARDSPERAPSLASILSSGTAGKILSAAETFCAGARTGRDEKKRIDCLSRLWRESCKKPPAPLRRL